MLGDVVEVREMSLVVWFRLNRGWLLIVDGKPMAENMYMLMD